MKTLRTRISWLMLGMFTWEWLKGPSKLEWVCLAMWEIGLGTALVLTYLGPRKWQ